MNDIYRRTIMVKTWHADGTFSSASYGAGDPRMMMQVMYGSKESEVSMLVKSCMCMDQ